METEPPSLPLIVNFGGSVCEMAAMWRRLLNLSCGRGIRLLLYTVRGHSDFRIVSVCAFVNQNAILGCRMDWAGRKQKDFGGLVGGYTARYLAEFKAGFWIY